MAENVGSQVSAGNTNIVGLMLESHLVEGRQDLPKNSLAGESVLDKLTYGQSITDACIGWDSTVKVLDSLAKAVRDRRNCKK